MNVFLAIANMSCAYDAVLPNSLQLGFIIIKLFSQVPAHIVETVTRFELRLNSELKFRMVDRIQSWCALLRR